MKRLLIAGMLAMAALVGGAVVAQDAKVITPSLTPQAAGKTVMTGSSIPPSAAGPRELTKEDVDAWLDGYVPAALHLGDIPGAVVVIVKDGQVLTARGFGYADVEKRLPVDPDRTLFRPGSVSKLFTWTAVMQLVEGGKLDLDADVNKYLDFKIPPFEGKPATLRQIMTHTAGFEEHGKGVVFYDTRYIQTLEAYLKANVPGRIYEPGTTPAYSNWATALAGYIVQRVSGEPFDNYVEGYIFAPLGMRSSTFRQPLPAAFKGQMSVGYGQGAKAGKFEIVGPAPAGSLSSPGGDMARYMIAILAGGTLDGRTILAKPTVDTMLNSPLDRVNPYSLMPPLNRMELGFFQINLNGNRAVGHLGDVNAFHTSLDLLLEQKIGIYVSVNSAGKGGAGGKLRLTLPEDFAARYLPAPAPAKLGVTPAVAKQHAQMMTGLWEASRRGQTSFFSLLYLLGQTKVTIGPDGSLVVPDVTGTNGRPREWIEIAPFLWQDRFGQERLAAKVMDGRVVRWSFDLAAPWEVFDRVPVGRSSAWILPAMYLSIAILLLTFLFWPIAWLIRRRYAAPLAVEGRARGLYRATRAMAGLDLALLLGWAMLISNLLGARSASPNDFDSALMILQVLGAVIFVGAVLVAAWNAYLTWSDGRRWTRKLWSALVLLATIMVLYFAHRFGLLAMTVSY